LLELHCLMIGILWHGPCNNLPVLEFHWLMIGILWHGPFNNLPAMEFHWLMIGILWHEPCNNLPVLEFHCLMIGILWHGPCNNLPVLEFHWSIVGICPVFWWGPCLHNDGVGRIDEWFPMSCLCPLTFKTILSSPKRFLSQSCKSGQFIGNYYHVSNIEWMLI